MEAVRSIRKERGWSQQRLADEANVNKVTLVHIETGKSSPNVETLERLARALNVELADFFPKAQAPLQLDFDGPAGHPERERLLGYLETSYGLVQRMRSRWKAAAEENTFSYEAWSEAVEVVTDLQKAFVEAVPLSVYATGEQWLPREEWEAVAGTLGSLSMLRDDLLVACANRFGGDLSPDNTVDLDAVREQKRKLQEAPEALRASEGSNTA